MRHRFDHLAKQIGKEALASSGITVAQDEISPETQHADLRHEPDPARGAERARLGLLGRLAAVLCLLEIYGHAPSADEVRACVSKHLAFWQQRARRARAKPKQSEAFVEPFLWIITAGCPTAVLAGREFARAPGWPRGVYLGSELFRMGIVVASELRRERSSLLVRLMAAGPLLPHAIEDLSALPADAQERAVASQILLNLQHALGKKPTRTPAEQEFIVSMQNIVEKLLDQGRDEGRDEGRLAGVRSSLRRVLAARKLTPSRADETRIDSCTDLAALDRWLDQAMAAASVAEALQAGRAEPRRRKGKRSS
jgi:hypothetical protein